MKEIISIFKKSAEIKLKFAEENAAKIERVVGVIVNALHEGGKILLFGNGGSAADAQHIAAEFVNRYLLDREPFAALALTTDTSILTSISNDINFEEIFSRQIAALGKKNDIAWGITTSGNSRNMIRAFEVSVELGLTTIGFTGKDGGTVASLADYNFNVDADSTPRIQETHITLAHVFCELVEKRMHTGWKK
ncbi:MAG: D-sedoheptulose 7-phosphate isomerase [Thermodesulfobacteriota bacterium]|jgi:D-sedoheptulose 7-phosphate isomerase|nr:MAG: D-sedoheptulose 7-phosphate isomerase [Thermodesulfobacteriota bacterium]